MSFQFRGIKRGSDVLKAAVENGDDPVDAFSRFLKGGSGTSGSTPATPSTAKRARTTKAAAPGSATTPSNKRHKAIKIEVGVDDDDDSPEIDFSELDITPTKNKAKPAQSTAQAQAGSVPGTRAPTPRHVPIAPASSRSAAASPAPPSYNLAPIPGVASVSLSDGYSNTPTGFGYNAMAPPTSMDGAAPSAANKPATGMTKARRGSAYSTGSYTAASSPATPSMWQDPTPSPMSNTTGYNDMTSIGDMNVNMGGQYPAVPSTVDASSNMTASMTNLDTATAMSTSSNNFSFNASTVRASPSPSESSFGIIAQPTVASSTATGTVTHGSNETATSTDASQEFFPSQGYTSTSRRADSTNGHSNHGNGDGYSTFNQQHEDDFAARVDFDDYEVQGEESDYDDTGEI